MPDIQNLQLRCPFRNKDRVLQRSLVWDVFGPVVVVSNFGSSGFLWILLILLVPVHCSSLVAAAFSSEPRTKTVLGLARAKGPMSPAL